MKEKRNSLRSLRIELQRIDLRLRGKGMGKSLENFGYWIAKKSWAIW